MGGKMKDSGIEWIGEIPSDWDVFKIKYGVVKVGSGKTPRGGADIYADSGVLFLRSQNIYDVGVVTESPIFITEKIDEEMKNTRVLPNDVLLNITGGSIGRCCIFPENLGKANVNQHVSIIRVNSEIFTAEYMHYFWICTLGKNAIGLYQTGGNREGMSVEAIKNTDIPMISIVEQKKITNYLDKKCTEIDTVINKTRVSIEEYKKLKQAIITEAVTKGVRGKRPMKDSGIDWVVEMPDEWIVMRIKFLFDVRDEKNYYPLSKVNLISLYTDMGVVQHSDLDKTTGNKASTADGYKKVYQDDIVVNIILCWMGAIGRSGYNGVTSPAYDIYIPHDDVNSRFYHYYFRTNGFSGDCYKRGRGIMAMRWRTYSDQFRDIRVVYPSVKEQAEIVGYLDKKCIEIDRLIEKKEQLLKELTAYKKSLIYEYVTGKKEAPAV